MAERLSSFAAYLSRNLREYQRDWPLVPEYLRSGDTVIGGLHFTEAAMEGLRDRNHPDFRRNWDIVLFRILYHHPYLFHVTEGAMRRSVMTFPGSRPVSFMTPVPNMTQAEYAE